jgi:capsid portal protein
MYSPNGKKNGIQIIPLSEMAAKDEFLNIKNVSRDDMMACWHVGMLACWQRIVYRLR